MGELLDPFRTRVKNLSRVPFPASSPPFSEAQLDQVIGEAVDEYNKALPLLLVQEFQTNGDTLFNLATLVTGWNESYWVKSLESQSEAGKRSHLDDANWETYQTATGWSLHVSAGYQDPIVEEWCSSLPATLYLTYAKPHTLALAESTVREKDKNPLANLAAAFLLEEYAAEASDTKSSSLRGDSVNYGEIPSNLLRMANRYKKKWLDHVSSQPGSDGAVFGEWDITTAYGRPLWHGGARF